MVPTAGQLARRKFVEGYGWCQLPCVLVLPVFVHGTYDWMLMNPWYENGDSIVMFTSLAVNVVMLVASYVYVRQMYVSLASAGLAGGRAAP